MAARRTVLRALLAGWLLAVPLAAAADSAAPKLKLLPLSSAQAAGDLLTAGCGGGFVAQGWTVTLARDGTITYSSYGPGQPEAAPRAAVVPPMPVKALFLRAVKLNAAAMPHAAGEIACTLTVTLSGQTLDGRFPNALGQPPAPAKPKPAERVFLDLVALANASFGPAGAPAQ